jgi:hypothetical protein
MAKGLNLKLEKRLVLQIEDMIFWKKCQKVQKFRKFYFFQKKI